MDTKLSTGEVVLLKLPGSEPKVVVQIRSESDTYPGCAQLTIHGGVEEGEGFSDALRREVREEIAELFRRIGQKAPPLLAQYFDRSPDDLHLVEYFSDDRAGIASHSFTISDPRFLDLIAPLLEHGILRILSRTDVEKIRSIDPADEAIRKEGVDTNTIAMFRDEWKILKLLLFSEDQALAA